MNRLRSLRDDQGFAMLVVIVLMLVGGAFVAAALAAADSDQGSSRRSQDRKAAYAAAEAGIEYYKFHLAQDNDYWTQCTNVPAPSALNDEWNPDTSATDTRTNWRSVPGTSAEYAVELLPASGMRCDPTSTTTAQSTMLDATGVFRIRSTGRVNGVKRSIVATFRRPSFLDYIYFTDFEVLDPWVGNDPAACEAYRPARAGLGCTEISFGNGDKVQGPLHTNDSVQVSSSVTFGKYASDPIEIALDQPGTINGCPSCVTWTGTLRSPWDKLPLPTSNQALRTVAGQAGGIRLTGLNTVKLDAATDTIRVWKNLRPDQVTPTTAPTVTYNWPAKQVLYDDAGATGCAGTDQPKFANYFDDNTGCAELFISGTYDKPLTIGSAADIVVAPSAWKEGDASKSTSADLTNTGDAVLGLIANGFVRVWHPVNSCVSRQPEQTNLRIDAAILALHSFIVDNWGCGKLGTLSVNGAIAQKFRGPVAQPPNGYVKSYTYDSRLKYRNPPFFLAPVDVAWKVATQHEQVPAT